MESCDRKAKPLCPSRSHPDVDYWELFDLKMDPHELRSVYGQPKYASVQKQLHAELQRLRQDPKVPDPDPPESLPVSAGSKKAEKER
jgi:hypothetical protein